MTYDIEGAVKEFRKIYRIEHKTIIGDEIDSMSNLLRSQLTQAIADIAKAFGGCMKCYGKGYSTQMLQEIGAEDFGNDGYVKDPEMVINPCSCDRGKQIKDILSTARKGE